LRHRQNWIHREVKAPKLTERLARWTSPNEIESLKREGQRIGLVELITAVSRLRLDVHAGNVEARALQALGRSTGPAE
jgi:hypothetical protein